MKNKNNTKKFIDIIKRDYGVVLSIEEAEEYSANLINLFETLIKANKEAN